MDNLKIALIAALLLLLFTRSAAALSFTQSDINTLCAEPMGTSIFSGTTSQQELLAIALIIMLTMLLISAAAYMLGYAFHISPLMRFSKDEMREVAVTALVVLVFLGSFSVVSSSAGLGSFLGSSAGTSTTNVFIKDCTVLAASSFNMVNQWVYLSTMQVLFNVAASFNIAIQPGDWGPFLMPLSGLSLLTDNSGMLGILATFAGVILIFLFAIAIMLGVFYTLFPLFFYAGIVLRTLPWTRAAGGAFLGLFISFYFVFPFLLYFFVSPYSQATLQQSTTPSLSTTMGSIASVSTFSSDPFGVISSVTSFFSDLSNPVLTSFATNVVEPSIFMLVAIVFSLMISLDFMEALGDMLGSPALSKSGALKGLI
jgi:hypothetical protein